MKKVLSLFLVLLLVVGTLYWLGIPNLSVNADQIGVIHTKTSGYELISEENRHRWDARKLLPHNYQVLTFSHHFQTFPIEIQSELPQSALLAEILKIDALKTVNPFAFHLKGELSMRVKPEHIIPLLQSGAIISNDLNSFYQEELQKIQSLFTEKFATASLETLQYSSQNRLLTLLREEFPHLEFSHISIQKLQMPNLDIYQLATDTLRSQNQESRQQQAEVELLHHQLLLEQERSLGEFKLELEKLEAMGELLSRYPILIAYLALERDHPIDSPLVMPFLQQGLASNSEASQTDSEE
ncbi:hypothetical protein [Entomospira culicis]|uniref:Uncharacterized protein n=1 Tax=Entomospira culicis TaxID=2719989 RepID=A0A968GFG0_9SPIO|nr:hypothetical protein [Entomospira culicis]NIZ19484.1 hypothetical protein [Entomospira culicis]NIZ69611.1 hypothetical protein [Entomospira culicis]WDI36722.1 hypothetical protein PVA46_05195 [Entomospira culicis]WDI38351.1 hypothetical protein PVA47_05205 [Entomospira culicis]